MSRDHSGLALPDDPLARHALLLRLLGQQCLALAKRTEQDGYPYWPGAPIDLSPEGTPLRWYISRQQARERGG